MHVLICGGGVIGASIAYFLGRRGIRSTVFERGRLACAASGKSGGFLALDWCDGTPLAPPAWRSFALHAELARDMEGEWGYRRLTTYGRLAGNFGRRGGRHHLDWLLPGASVAPLLGSTETTAQVHPARFTEAMMRAAQALGAELRHGCVSDVMLGGDGAAVGIAVDGETVPGDSVVVAMGPWSILASAWLPLPAVYGLKGTASYSTPGRASRPKRCFANISRRTARRKTPRCSRAATARPMSAPFRARRHCLSTPWRSRPIPAPSSAWNAFAATFHLRLRQKESEARQACFRPVTHDGLPLIGAVPGVPAAFVATGHSVWGILNAPATGEAMAELIADGAARSVDLSPFNPGRLPPLDPARLKLASGRS